MIPTQVQVNKKVKDELEPRHAVFTFDFPENVSECLARYGEATTHRFINESITLAVQGPARKVLEALPAGLSTEEYSAKVAEQMKDYKVEIKRTRGPLTPKLSPYQQVASELADPTKRDAIIAKFRELGINLDSRDGTVEASTPNGTLEENEEENGDNSDEQFVEAVSSRRRR